MGGKVEIKDGEEENQGGALWEAERLGRRYVTRDL